MDNVDLPQKVLQFEAFVNDVLREELKKFEHLLDGVNKEIAEYMELKTMLDTTSSANLGPNGYKTKIDIGCNLYVQANVYEPSTIFVDVGLGHFVEMSPGDASRFADLRIDLLSRRAEILRKNSARTKAHIKYLLSAVTSLQENPENVPR